MILRERFWPYAAFGLGIAIAAGGIGRGDWALATFGGFLLGAGAQWMARLDDER